MLAEKDVGQQILNIFIFLCKNYSAVLSFLSNDEASADLPAAETKQQSRAMLFNDKNFKKCAYFVTVCNNYTLYLKINQGNYKNLVKIV